MMYKDAGVDIDAGAQLVKRIKQLSPEIGGFGGLFPLGNSFLVASTDGVGTKLKLAFQTDCHETIGIDLVAMCVNDILVSGARPLFFLDYFASSKLDVDKAEIVIKGIVSGCREAGCALLGGETAEMPGFYHAGEYDLSGFAVGIVEKDQLIDGKNIRAGDKVIGLASSGIHSNGFSLIRKVLSDSAPSDSLLKSLLLPTRIYVNDVMDLLKDASIKGMAHITGGGIVENLPRCLPEGLGARLDKSSWEVPSLFRWVQKEGSITEDEMYRIFNMGIGFILIVSPDAAEEVCKKEAFFEIGIITEGKGVSWA